jgi:oligopeptide transport system substrate-binding protein
MMQRSLISMLALGLSLAVNAQASTPVTNKFIQFAISQEPPQLNGMKATDQVSFFVLGHVMEGLTRYSKDGGNEPGVAEKWTIGDKEATFNLRKNAKWSDGKPVTAKDFVYAWRTVVDPKTASEYAFIMFPLKNAEKINKGEMKPDALGVKAVDDYTLKVEFEKPTGYFLSLTAFATYFPVREDFHKKAGEKYGADADKLIFNGPFTLEEWVHGASLKMPKNQQYWNAKSVKIDGINVPYITPDNKARFNFFKDKKVDLLEALSKNDLPEAQKEKFKLQSFSDGTLLFMEFNFMPGRPTANLNLRKAIAAIFNPNEYVSKIIGIPQTKPGKGLVPHWLKGTKASFRSEYPMPNRKQDLAAAKKYIELAKKELGGKIPALIWLTGDTPLASQEAEYWQSEFKKHLGVELKIDKQIFKQRLAKMTAGEFDIVAAGWGPDFADPMTFIELMASWNENNRGRYKNAEFDKHVRVAQGTAVQKTRMDAMAAAEKIAIDELAILPTYERNVIWVKHDRVDGIMRHQIGMDPDFTKAFVK